MEACTIVARNYLPHARVLARSLTAVHPASRLTVLVIDGSADASDDGLFRPIELADIVPDRAERQRLAFIYDVTELSTAIKPLLLRHLLQEGATTVLYFDPDIEVFHSIECLWALAAEHGVALTPHVLSPVPDDGYGISDLFVLRAGVYNLGFIGIGAGDGSEDLLAWWSGRLRRHCIVDFDRGLFVDQRWIDSVPGMFRHVTVRDPGCNVAYWNLHERPLARTTRGLSVKGRPLRFFHFSGFDPEVPHLLSRHQGPNPRILLSEHRIVGELCERYARNVRTSAREQDRVGYAFSTLPDGTLVDPTMRRLYRRALIDAEASGAPLPPLPFDGDGLVEWLNEPSLEAPRLSRYLLALYQERLDLRQTFPMPYGDGAEAYLNWVRHDAVAARTIPASLRPAARAATSAPPHRAEYGSGINIAGYFQAEHSVGEVARLLASAARNEGIPVTTFIHDETAGRPDDGSAFEQADGPAPHGVTLICANADELPRVIDTLPAGIVEGCHRIGFWFWETETLPTLYEPAAAMVDEIWVASEYVAAAVRKTVSTPVHVCPLPVRVPQPANLSRADLGLPEGFLFLFVFDFLSVPVRKNATGLVEAFCHAFRPGEGPTLVLKSVNGRISRAAFETLRAAGGGRADVICVDQYLTDPERDALMGLCDCYVSLHLSEGFGLPLVEAMVLEKPTIATAYSGNLTFMTPENSFLVPCRPAVVPPGCEPYPEGDDWAEPDLSVAASLMRSVYENPALAGERGRRARKDVVEQLSPARTGAFLRERLDAIARQRQPAPAAKDPIGVAAPPSPPPPDERAPRFAAQLDEARREVAEAEHLLAQGLQYGDQSRFGWLGRLLRTAIMRILRPYSQFQIRVQQRHLRSTAQVLDCLRALDAEIRPDARLPQQASGADDRHDRQPRSQPR